MIEKLKSIGLLPLVILALIGVVGVGAVAYYLIFSTTITSSFTTTGINAMAIQAGNHGNYASKITATTLATQKDGLNDATTYATNCVNLVVLGSTLNTEDLRLVIEVLDHSTGAPLNPTTWVATPIYVSFNWISGNGNIDNNLGSPNGHISNSTHQMWTISHADIQKMTWIDISNPSGHSSPQPANDLIIPVTFTTSYNPTSEVRNIDIKIWLQVVTP